MEELTMLGLIKSLILRNADAGDNSTEGKWADQMSRLSRIAKTSDSIRANESGSRTKAHAALPTIVVADGQFLCSQPTAERHGWPQTQSAISLRSLDRGNGFWERLVLSQRRSEKLRQHFINNLDGKWH